MRSFFYWCLLAGAVGDLLLSNCASAGLVHSDVAPASTIRHDRPDSSYTDLASAFPATGLLTWPGFLCSGNFVQNFGASGWVLTAAHCVDDGTAANQFSFTVGGTPYVGDAIFAAPTYTNFADSVFKGDDIALLRLASTVAGVSPASLYTGLAELGATGTHVGLGETGTGLTGTTQPAGTKRAVQNTIDDFWLGGQLTDDFDHPDGSENQIGSATPLDLEGMIAPGDSGGGLYIDFGSGFELAGVHSFIASSDGANDADYGDLSGSTRVSTHAAWIHTTIAANSMAVPEPSAFVLASLAAGSLVVGRRLRPKRAA